MRTLRGLIERRLLINFRVDPAALARVLPAPFRPRLVRGVGLGGICLIRLAHVRPGALPRAVGVSSENAAHRIAVEWDEGGVTREGVFIPRRDTSSPLNALVGGALFHSDYRLARFSVEEAEDRYRVEVESRDGAVHIGVEARRAPALLGGSIFGSLGEASDFFERGGAGYSPTPRPGLFAEMCLETAGWRVEPLEPTKVASSWFSDPARFPAGTVELDSALLMRGIEHVWRAREASLAA